MPRPIKHIPGHSSHAIRRPCVVSTAFVCPPVFFFLSPIFHAVRSHAWTPFVNVLSEGWFLPPRWHVGQLCCQIEDDRRQLDLLRLLQSLLALRRPQTWHLDAFLQVNQCFLVHRYIYIYIYCTSAMINPANVLYSKLCNTVSLKQDTTVPWSCWLNLEMYGICIVIEILRRLNSNTL